MPIESRPSDRVCEFEFVRKFVYRRTGRRTLVYATERSVRNIENTLSESTLATAHHFWTFQHNKSPTYACGVVQHCNQICNHEIAISVNSRAEERRLSPPRPRLRETSTDLKTAQREECSHANIKSSVHRVPAIRPCLRVCSQVCLQTNWQTHWCTLRNVRGTSKTHM